MDKIKQTTGKLKGGVLAAIIATLIALLTVGAGVAFGAEGIRDGVMNFITETVGGTIGGITQTFGGGNGDATGNLAVSVSTVASPWMDPTHDFSMTVTLGDTNINGTYGDMTFTDGVATVLAKNGQTKTATGLPAGTTWSIANNENGFYNATRSIDGGIYGSLLVSNGGSIAADTTSAIDLKYAVTTANMTVVKTWDDDGDAAGARPESITVHIFGDSDELASATLLGTAATVTSTGNGTQWRFEDAITVPQCRTDGTPYASSKGDGFCYYSATEDTIANYELTSSSVVPSKNMRAALTNTYTPPTVDIPVTKTWVDNNNEYNNRPASVTYRLYAAVPSDSNTRSDTEPTLVATKVATSEDSYATTFEGLPVEDGFGNELVYCVGEDAVPGYMDVSAYSYATWGGYYSLYNRFDGTNPVKINNRKVQDKSFYLMKLWSDENHEDARPADGVTFHLYANGVEVASKTLTSADASNCHSSSPNYGKMWCNKMGVGTPPQSFPAYQNGEEVNYTVAEDAVAGYASTVEYNQSVYSLAGNDIKGYTGVLVTNTYAPSVTGSLTVSKTVSGTGADTSQGFAFTVTFTGNIADDTYGDMTVNSGVATFSLSHGQSVTATGLPAGITYAVSEASVANYEPSWTGQSGTVTAGGSATASCENVYTAPSYITPDTTDFSVTRTDEGAGAGSTMLMLTESIPAGTSAAGLNRSALKMTVQPPVTEIEPTVDTTNNALSYNFSLDNGQTMSVPLVRGSNVTITNNTSGVDLTDTNDSDTPTIGTSFSVGNSASPMSMTLMGAESANSGSQHESRPQGWIRVNSSAGNTVTYDAFKVFDAAVTYDDPDYRATHLEWEDSTVKSAVMTFLRNATNHNDYDAWLASKYNLLVGSITNEIEENPQNAAEWIALKIADSTEDTTANTTPKTTKGETFATQLALTLRQSNVQPTVVQPNTVTQVDQGYYLVGTTPSTIGDGEVGTAPIWAPVPQTGYTVDEKVGIPTFNKQVKDNTDVTDSYGKIADASTGQWLDFKMTSVMPSNLEAFPTYPLTITDVVPAGMDATISKDNGFSVYLGETDITDLVTTTLVGRTLTVSVSDMRSIDGVDVTGNDVLTVNYRAKLNENSVKGNAGNTNTATLTYRADPLTETTASLTSSATVLTYGIQLDKVDEATRLDVNGAQFAVKAIGLGANNSDLWVKSDGSLTSTEAERGIWTTTNGTITVSGLDEGTYDLVEVAAPNLYEVLATPVRVIIDAQKNYANGTLTSLGATVSGGNGNMVQNPTAAQDGYLDSDMATGIVHLRASDVRQVVLPLTGMPVKTAAIIVGIAVAVISCVAYVMSKRNRDDSEGDDEE